MANQRATPKSGTLIKLAQASVLLLFVSLLAFSAGAFIGKKVSDSEHRRAQLEGEYQGLAAHSEATEAPTGEENLSDDDIASLTEEFVTKAKNDEAMASTDAAPAREVASASESTAGYKKFKGKTDKEPTQESKPADHGKPTADHAAHAAPHGKPAAASHNKPVADHAAPAAKTAAPEASAAHGKTAAPAAMPSAPAAHGKPAADKPAAPAAHEAAAKPSVMAARVAEGQAPAPDAKEERKPMSVLPSVAATAVGKYTVQVASYPDENEAKNHAATLKSGGWNAFYVPAEVQGKMWYRVSVGLFTSAKSAAEFRKEFQKEAKVATAIVQKIVK